VRPVAEAGSTAIAGIIENRDQQIACESAIGANHRRIKVNQQRF